MHSAYESRAADLAAYLEHLRWQPGQTGVVAAAASGILCADLFDRPETLQRLWDRLIPSYALEAMTRPGRTVLASDAEAFLREGATAEITTHQAVGRGTDLRLTSGTIVGAALEVEQTIIHLSLFRIQKRTHDRSGLALASMDERRRRLLGQR
jgi:hypothetical protein